MVDDSKETASFRHNMTDTHKNSQRLSQHAQDTHRFKSDRIPELGRINGHKVPPITKNLFVIDTCRQRRKTCFLQWSVVGPGVAFLISKKIDFKLKLIRKDRKGEIHQEDFTVLSTKYKGT